MFKLNKLPDKHLKYYFETSIIFFGKTSNLGHTVHTHTHTKTKILIIFEIYTKIGM